MTPTHHTWPTPDTPLDEVTEHENLIRDALNLPEDVYLADKLADLRPEDFADQLEQLTPENRRIFIARAGTLITADILAELEDEVVEDILPLLPRTQIVEAITELDSDDATQIVEEMEAAQREEVLEALQPADRADLEASFAYDDETIGRLMQREFVAAPPFWTVGDTIDHMRATGEDLPDLFFNIWIIDTAFHPVGYMPVSTLMRSPREATLGELSSEDITAIGPEMDQEDAAYLFEKYNLISAPVVDVNGRLIGMMTVDDIVEIIQDENKEDILALAGVSDAGITDTAFSTVRARAPWLFVNLLTAVLASLVIAQFEFAISQIVALAILMPIVASMGGNAGTQALTVAVRALSERELTSQTAWRSIRREAIAAMINGIIFALTLGLITWVWFGNETLAVVACLAMIINHAVAGLSGILIPLGLKRIGADPAVSSSVFVTTITDVIGFFAFLGFAVFFLL